MAQREFGERVRRMRLQRRWTLDELAERSGVSRAAISKIERGERSTRLSGVIRIAEAFGVQPGGLLDSVARPPRVLHQPLVARWDGPASTVSRQYLAEVDTGVDLLRYHLPVCEMPTVLASQEPGVRQVVVLLTGGVVVGSGAEQVELNGGDVALVSGEREHPLHNTGVEGAELLVIVSRPGIR